MKIVATSGTGLIGSKTVAILRERGRTDDFAAASQGMYSRRR